MIPYPPNNLCPICKQVIDIAPQNELLENVEFEFACTNEGCQFHVYKFIDEILCFNIKLNDFIFYKTKGQRDGVFMLKKTLFLNEKPKLLPINPEDAIQAIYNNSMFKIINFL